MAEKGWLLGETPNPLGDRLDEIRGSLMQKRPDILANRTGSTYTAKSETTGEFKLEFWTRQVVISYPEFSGTYPETGENINSFDMTMLAYYFNICDGTPMTGEWIAFNQIPGGVFYAQAFQSYTGNELAKVFKNDSEAFIDANLRLQGRREFFGNISFSYQVLPRVPIMVVCWLGDEELPSSYRILFDKNAHHHLVTDAYAILGSTLTRHLIKAYVEK